jgi:hypothetical protein
MRKDKGFILLEGFLGIFLLFIIGGAALQGLCRGAALWNAVMREMEMRQVTRDLKTRLASYFCYQCHGLRIEQNELGSRVDGTSVHSSKRTVFYLARLPDRDYPTLYINVRNDGGEPGINPLLPPHIGAANLSVKVLSEERLQWEMDLIHKQSDRTYHFREVFPYDAW